MVEVIRIPSFYDWRGQIIEQYESMIKPDGFTIVDGTLSIEEQQQLVRETVRKFTFTVQETEKDSSLILQLDWGETAKCIYKMKKYE